LTRFYSFEKYEIATIPSVSATPEMKRLMMMPGCLYTDPGLKGIQNKKWEAGFKRLLSGPGDYAQLLLNALPQTGGMAVPSLSIFRDIPEYHENCLLLIRPYTKPLVRRRGRLP
jgi:hypothetical protein